MTVSFKWADEDKSILYYYYDGEWTWEETFEALEKSRPLLDNSPIPVYMVIELDNEVYFPKDSMEQLKQVVAYRATHPKDSGITVFINAEVLTKAMLDVIQMSDRTASQFVTFHHAESLEEAIQLIEKIKAEGDESGN